MLENIEITSKKKLFVPGLDRDYLRAWNRLLGGRILASRKTIRFLKPNGLYLQAAHTDRQIEWITGLHLSF